MELNRLLQVGIIEYMDAFKWVSTFLVAWKPRGGLQFCVDLHEPIKSVIMECYPLPRMGCLFAEVASAPHYSQVDLSSVYHQLPLQLESHS